MWSTAGPQTREQIQGRDAYIRFDVEDSPGEWHVTVLRIVKSHTATIDSSLGESGD
jgi:hypothetical protein